MTDAKKSGPGLPYVVKRVAEAVTYDLDFTPLLRTGETLATLTAVFATPDGLDLEDPAMATPFVQVQVAGGVDGTDYILAARAETSLGDTRQVEGEVRVREPA